jgi:transcriptional regulator with GAF, ATPase, and Fis domain
MDLARLPDIILAIAEKRSLDSVLHAIVQEVAAQPGVAAARIWLRESGKTCPRPECKQVGTKLALHLRASAGTPRGSAADWMRTDGVLHLVQDESKSEIAHIATTGTAVRISDLKNDTRWHWDPELIHAESLVGLCARPLISKGEVLGVLSVFRTTSADDNCWEWLRILSDTAAVAVANARAFEQVESLRRELELERDYLREEVIETGAFGEILGHSPVLHRVLRQVELVAVTEANVLIQGESGSGKELIARAIHQRSLRAKRPLVKVNCGSIPRELFESEFFGHARGSFTGAIRDRIGRFQLADGGTLFLDEVGEIPLELQSKLLRVLQEGEFERVGEDTTRKVNVRVIAASNRDLRNEVSEGKFRLDLFYRLGVFPIDCPPLRSRLEDIPELIADFIKKACARLHVPEPKVPQRELEKAQQYGWPGNVRELQNVIERAVILARGGALTLDLGKAPVLLLMPHVAEPDANEVISRDEWRERERANVLAALRKADYRVSGKGGAAELLGVNPATLASQLKSLGISRPRSADRANAI